MTVGIKEIHQAIEDNNTDAIIASLNLISRVTHHEIAKYFFIMILFCFQKICTPLTLRSLDLTQNIQLKSLLLN